MEKYIKRIKIEKVEAELETELYRDKIVLGCDVSMHNTGLAVIRTTSDYLILDIIKNIITPRDISLLKAVDLFIDQVEDFKRQITQKYKLDINIIEDCFFSKNAKTLKYLARFGILVYDRFRGIASKAEFITPTEARKAINFKKSSKSVKGSRLKKEIMYYINNALQTKIKDDNQADAIVLALSGLVIKEEDLY